MWTDNIYEMKQVLLNLKANGRIADGLSTEEAEGDGI